MRKVEEIEKAIELLSTENEWRNSEIERWKNIADASKSEGRVIKGQEFYSFNGFVVSGENAIKCLNAHSEKIKANETAIDALVAINDGRLVILPSVKGADIDNPLEPLKVYSALKSEVMKYEYRAEHEPQKINILDLTIIKALQDVLTRAEAEKVLEAGNAEHKTC